MALNTARRLARTALSFLPYTGLAPKPSERPAGITALMRVLNEKDWLRESLYSIKDYVDEIVIVDNGSDDGTWEELNVLGKEIPKIKLFRFTNKLPWEFSSFALGKSSFRWILKWDADYVAMTAGENTFGTFISFIRSLDPNRHFFINPRIAEFAGDFYHHFPAVPSRNDIEAFTYSGRIAYTEIERVSPISIHPVKLPAGMGPEMYRRSMEATRVPVFYETRQYDTLIGIHVNLKPAERLLYGYFWPQWLFRDNRTRHASVWDYIDEYAVRHWKCTDRSSAARIFVNEYVKSLTAYDELTLKKLHASVEAMVQRSPYRVLYRDGVIIGRNDGEPR